MLIDFQLVGARDYIRGTDIVRRLREIFPDQELTLKLISPLSGRAVLSETKPPHICMRIKAGQGMWFLSHDADAPAPVRKAQETNVVRSFTFRVRNFYLLTFRGPGGLEDRLERLFDMEHPKMAKKFIVRRVRIMPKIAERNFAFWFKLRVHNSGNTARIAIRSLKGPICTVDFMLRDHSL